MICKCQSLLTLECPTLCTVIVPMKLLFSKIIINSKFCIDITNILWKAKIWMQYSVSHVATTSLLPSQNGIKTIAEHQISKIFWESMPTNPPYSCIHTH